MDEVIMCTFQQSVYYLTKVGLAPSLPVCHGTTSGSEDLTVLCLAITSELPSPDLFSFFKVLSPFTLF